MALEAALQLGYAVLWSVARQREVRAATATGAAVPTVLCVGDSFTYGMGASTRAGSYPAQLERRLADATGRPWQVVNRGWPGRDSREVLAAIDGQLAQVRPQIVCIAVGVNDTWRLPEELTPDAVVAAPPADAGEPFVWRFRTWRMLSLLRAWRPFAASAPSASAASEWLVGEWTCRETQQAVVFAADGTGSFDGASLRWQCEGDRLQLVLQALPAMVGTLRREADVLVYTAAGSEVAMHWQRGALPPAIAAARALAAGDAERARADFLRAIASPSTPPAELPMLRASCARACMRLGRRDEADVQLAQLRAAYAHDANLTNLEALLDGLRATQCDGEALQLLEGVLPTVPDSALVLANHAELTADRAAARASIARAIAIATSTGQDRVHLLRKQAWLHREPEAVEAFAAAAIAAHQLDHRRDLTRQLLAMWMGEPERQRAALRRAGAAVGADADELLAILAEARGETAVAWRRVYAQHLTRLVVRCRAAGAEPVLVSYPFRFVGRDDAEAVAAAQGCLFVAADDAVAAVRAAAPDRVLQAPDGHCNDDGYGVMAGAVATAVAPLATRLLRQWPVLRPR